MPEICRVLLGKKFFFLLNTHLKHTVEEQKLIFFYSFAALYFLEHSFFGSEWQKRWCVLNRRTFYYYANEKSKWWDICLWSPNRGRWLRAPTGLEKRRGEPLLKNRLISGERKAYTVGRLQFPIKAQHRGSRQVDLSLHAHTHAPATTSKHLYRYGTREDRHRNRAVCK